MEENNITVDKAVQTIKGAILRAQAQASQSSNAIQLSLYYGIGRYVSINLQQAHWGAKALDSISERLQRELPGLRGFSSGNLKKMRIFYEEWQCLSIGSPLANQLQQLENKILKFHKFNQGAYANVQGAPRFLWFCASYFC